MIMNYGDYSTGKDDMALEILKVICKSRDKRIKTLFVKIINKYFDIDKGDSDCYILTRSKEGFQYGTVTLDDFEEFNDGVSDELADYILKGISDEDLR